MEYEKTHFIFTHFKVSSEQKTNWMIPNEKIQLERFPKKQLTTQMTQRTQKQKKTECYKIELKCCKTAMYGAKNMSLTYIGSIL